MIKWLFLLILGFILYSLPTFCKRQTDGFSQLRITTQLPLDLHYPQMQLCEEEEHELNDALNQPYSYLGRGGQSFAFVSRDGKYVVKFFKTEFHPFGSLWWKTLPFFSKEKSAQLIMHARRKLERDFGSYTLSGSELKEQTATLYMHLTPSSHLKRQLHIQDKLGIFQQIDLDHFSFAVQRHAELAFPYIHRCIKNSDLKRAHEAIHALIELSTLRCEKGIHDEDAKIHKNYGFLDDKPIFIDLGRFVKDPSRSSPSVYQKDISALLLQLKQEFPLLFDNPCQAYD